MNGGFNRKITYVYRKSSFSMGKSWPFSSIFQQVMFDYQSLNVQEDLVPRHQGIGVGKARHRPAVASEPSVP